MGRIERGGRWSGGSATVGLCQNRDPAEGVGPYMSNRAGLGGGWLSSSKTEGRKSKVGDGWPLARTRWRRLAGRGRFCEKCFYQTKPLLRGVFIVKNGTFKVFFENAQKKQSH